jgi:hypothetical protein
MSRIAAAFVLSLVAALPAAANDFSPVREKSEFLSLVEGRELRLNLFRIRLEVLPDGRIEGSALGWGITGSWDWQDGYFCRQMDWSGMDIPFNCQLVEARGEQELRFTVDKGAGDSASFKLR